MTNTPTAVEHGITVTEVTTPAGTPRRADCFCGWQSQLLPSNPQALAAGEAHVESARSASSDASGASPMGDVAPDEHETTLLTLQDVSQMTGFRDEEVLGCWRANRQTAPIAYRVGKRLVYLRRQVEEWMRGMGLPTKSSGHALATGLVECAPWCAYEDDRGHVGSLFREDQWCGTELLSVPMTSRYRTDEIRVSGLRHPDEAPTVEVDLILASGDECGSQMTLAEAVQLVEALQLVLGLVDTHAEAGR